MKKLTTTAVMLFYLLSAVYAQPGSLALPELEVWGVDRSVLPGIYGQRLKLRPNLNKNLYLHLAGEKIPPKSYPKRSRDWKNGLNISAGAGSYGEYILGLNHDLHSREGWFVNYKAEGIRKNLLMAEDQNNSFFKFSFSGGRQGSSYGYLARGGGYQNDIGSLKTLYRSGGDAYVMFGPLKTDFSGGFSSLSGPQADASRGKLNFKMGLPINYYHHISADILAESLEIAGQSDEEVEFNVSYLNEVYRDAAFSVGAGYKDEFLYNIMASAGVGNFSFAGYFYKEQERKTFDNQVSAYPYFVLDKFYKYPIKEKGGIDIKNQIGGGYEAGLSISRSLYSDYLYFFKRDDGKVNLRNFKEKVTISELEVDIKGDFLKIGYIYRQADEEIPDIYNELYADFNLRLLSRLDFLAGVNYADRHQQYLNEEGSQREEVDSYLNIDAALNYNIGADFKITGGVENILAADIVRTGRCSEDAVKFFVMVDFDIGNKEGGLR